MREGIRLANSRGVVSVHDKDGWLGALGLWQELRDRGLADAAGLAVAPAHDARRARGASVSAPGLGDDLLRAGYLKAFMDGTLGSMTARLLDGSGVEITSRDELEEIVRRGAALGWPVAVHAIGDLREPGRARRLRGLARRLGPAEAPPPDRARAAARAGGRRRASARSASRLRCSSRTRPPTATSPTATGRGFTDRAYAWRSLLDAGAVLANGSDAPIEELDPLMGIRAGVLRSLDDRPGVAPRAGGHRAAGVRGDHDGTRVALRRRAPPRQARPRLPRRPGRPRPRPVRDRPVRASGGAGGRDDARRPLGPQPAALGRRD